MAHLKDNSAQIAGYVTTEHSTYTVLDITGSGFFQGFINVYWMDVRIQIDGGNIYHLSSPTRVIPMMLRFKSSLKVSASGSGGNQGRAYFYMLD